MVQKEITQQIELASTIESLTKTEQFIETVCEKYAFGEDTYGNILIAITEAVNNAITHGNQLDLTKKVLLSMTATTSEVQFIVQDEGNGFDYNNIPDPTLPENIEKNNGRGVFLMKALADKVEFEDNGKSLIINFSLSKS